MLHRIALIVLLTAAPLWAQEQSPETPDLSDMDAPTLRVLCQQLYQRVAQLEAEVAELKGQIAGEYGGTTAEVDGGMVSLAEGTWTVTITTNPEPDLAPIQAQIAAQQAMLSGQNGSEGISARLESARQKVAEMETAEERYYDSDDQRYETRDKYSSKEIRAARATLSQVEREKQTVNVRIHQFEQQIRRLQTVRNITGMTDEGVPVTITARGVHYAAGASLQKGLTYQVVGQGHFTESSGEIQLKSAVPADTAAAASAIMTDGHDGQQGAP